eukprot:2535471-Amphidinium_carterae.1
MAYFVVRPNRSTLCNLSSFAWTKQTRHIALKTAEVHKGGSATSFATTETLQNERNGKANACRSVVVDDCLLSFFGWLLLSEDRVLRCALGVWPLIAARRTVWRGEARYRVGCADEFDVVLLRTAETKELA